MPCVMLGAYSRGGSKPYCSLLLSEENSGKEKSKSVAIRGKES